MCRRPFPLSGGDVSTVGYIGVYGPIPTGDCDWDCDIAIVIAKKGSVSNFAIAIS